MLGKILGSLLVIFSTSYYGYLLGYKQKKRLFELRCLQKNLYQLRAEIEYGRTPLPEAMGALGRRQDTVFSAFFLSMEERLACFDGNSFYRIWKEEIEKNLQQTELTKQDKSKLILLGETLGYLDQSLQLRNIDLYLRTLEEEMEEENRAQKEKVRLFQLLGILGGIFLSVIMI